MAELGDDAIRELPVYGYHIVYEIRTADTVVLAVIHKRRDLQPVMIDRHQTVVCTRVLQ